MEQTLAIDAGRSARLQRQDGHRLRGVARRRSIERVPPPTGDPEARRSRRWCSTRHYDEYRGAITYVRVMNGTRRRRAEDQVSSRQGTTHEVVELGQFAPRRKAAAISWRPGRSATSICNIKSLGNVHIGDTVTVPGDHAGRALAGLRRAEADGVLRPLSVGRPGLRSSCAKRSTSCTINDPSFDFEPETSDALGFGFRCGFLGLLHMEIVQQRLEEEADIDLVQTAPNVTYEIVHEDGRDARSPHAAATCPIRATSRSSASRSCG